MKNEMGKLYVVATPIGNLDDMSLRTKSTLTQVDWIAAEDTRHSGVLLQHCGIQTPLIAYHDHNEATRVNALIEKLKAGEQGALISDAGTPLISDPGFLLVDRALEEGISVIPIPGPCALIAALSVAGLPTDKFIFEGFLPAKSAARQKRLKDLISLPHTLVFYEAPHRIQESLKDAAEVLGNTRLATIGREITKKFESFYRDDLGNLVAQMENGDIPCKGEFILMISGNHEELEPQWSEVQKMLEILMLELTLKKAVEVTVKLSGLPKNKIYDLAMKLKG